MGKKGNLGPVCKIYAYDRWQKSDPTPQNYTLKEAYMQNLNKKYWQEKELEGVSFWQLFQRAMTSSPKMTFFVKMSIHILYTLAKFHFEMQTLSKIMGKKRLWEPVAPPPQDARRVNNTNERCLI